MMKQYEQAKQACGDALLLFRMGDFYELFHDDAKVAAKALGLTLTSRDKKTNPVPMAGFPYHQLDGYLGKLIAAGYRVAVCEQVEDPKAAKGLVKREVTRVVTPGTITDQSLLDPNSASFLAALYQSPDKKKPDDFGLAWLELSTGIFQATEGPRKTIADLLTKLAPREILVKEDQSLPSEMVGEGTLVTNRPAWSFGFPKSKEILCLQFKTKTLDGFGFEDHDQLSIQSAGAILEYLHETQKTSLDHIDRLTRHLPGEYLEIDQASWRSLEITQTTRSRSREGSLLSILDRTQTSMGARKLAAWLTNPLKNVDSINLRLDAVEEFKNDPSLRNNTRKFLKSVFDLQRLLSRVTSGRASPRDISCVGQTLAQLPEIKELIKGRTSRLLQQLEADLDLCVELRKEIEAALVDDCPPNTKDGNFLREGFNSQLDEYRQLATGGKEWIARYQAKIAEETGIPSLKVGFNKVFGYYLEVTHTHRDRVPDDFIRKQTLKNAERFITPELKEYEEKVMAADEKSMELELELFQGLREFTRSYIERLKVNSEVLATLDVIAALAELASMQNYCRPKVTPHVETRIVEGRHPVLDVTEPQGTFVPNDVLLDGEQGLIHLITGPNMAGKSTYIRQVALISIMAQIGSFVPAGEAVVGIADQIFARIGASDELSRGQSTFMVEMSETARILNTATDKSLVILDEIGRGTSTYDGVSLAWAIVEYLHDQIGCRTLFATHYHELTELEKSMQYVRNFNVAVKEWQDEIVFLHRIVPGSADKSYGIHVARLAGVPNWVNQRADAILSKLESESDSQAIPVGSSGARSNGEVQMTLFEMVDHPLIEKIKSIDPNQVTPIDALQMLGEWKQELDSSGTTANSKK